MSSRFAEFRFGWPVVLASALGIGLGLSPLPFYTIGVFVAPLTNDLGWSVSQIMSALPVLTFGALLMSPLIGIITDRVGVRKVVLTSVVCFSATMMAFSLNTGSMTLYLFLWVLLAVTGAGTLPITWTRAVNSWFLESRGLALGLSLVGTGVFGFLVTNYSSFLIDRVGWRLAYIGLGILPMIIAFPVAWFVLFESTDPRVAGRAAEMHRASRHSAALAISGIALKSALRDWRFWLLAYSFVPVSFAIGGPIPNLVNLLGTKGFTASEAAFLASLIAFPGVIAGRVLGGYLLDRFWAPAVAAIILSIPAAAVLMLTQGELSYAAAATAIIVLGFAAGVEYDLMAYLVSRYFGLASYAAIYGCLYGFFALGAGIGPWVFGHSFEATGSYDSVLKIAAVLFLIGALPLLLLGRYRDFSVAPAVVDEATASA